MDEFQFPVRYAGPAVQKGRIEVRDLAPSLVGLGTTCQRIAEHLYGPETRLRVEIATQPRPGSFVTDLVLVVVGAAALLMPEHAAAAVVARLKKTVTLFKQFGGKKEKPSIREVSGDTVVIGDGNRVVKIERVDVKILMDRAVQEGVAQLARPLEKDGIEEIGIGTGDPEGVLARADAPALVSEEPILKEPGTIEKCETREAVVLPIQVRLDGNERAWRVAERDQTFNVRVEDQEFLADVKSGKLTLTGGTALRVTLLTKWDETPSNQATSVQRSVLKVLKIIPPRGTGSFLPSEE